MPRGEQGWFSAPQKGREHVAALGSEVTYRSRCRSQALDIDVGVFNVKVQISGSSVFLLQSFYMMSVQ